MSNGQWSIGRIKKRFRFREKLRTPTVYIFFHLVIQHRSNTVKFANIFYHEYAIGNVIFATSSKNVRKKIVAVMFGKKKKNTLKVFF